MSPSPTVRLAGPIPAGADPESYDRLRRRVLWSLPTGLYLLCSRAGERRNWMTCNWATQVATDPKLVAVSVERGADTYELIRAGRCFALALLAREDRALARRFVKPATDDAGQKTLNGVPYRDAPATGVPLPEGAVAFLDCRVEREVALGSHSLFVGEVVDAAGPAEGEIPVLRMEDTRMSYGG